MLSPYGKILRNLNYQKGIKKDVLELALYLKLFINSKLKAKYPIFTNW